jgi:4-hydroxyphenylacetate 3-monooxygenase
VKVPWERVFLLDDAQLSREMYFKTPAHVMSNHQSIVRYHEKLKLILGFAYRAAEMNNVLQVPAVRETLSKLAVAEAGVKGWIAGQIEGCRDRRALCSRQSPRALLGAVLVHE